MSEIYDLLTKLLMKDSILYPSKEVMESIKKDVTKFLSGEYYLEWDSTQNRLIFHDRKGWILAREYEDILKGLVLVREYEEILEGLPTL